MTKYYIVDFKICSNAYLPQSMIISNESVYDNKYNGCRYNISDLKIELPKSRGIVQDFIDNLHSLLIVSEDIKDVFALSDSHNIEYYPVELNRKTDKRYYLINILNNIDCIDFVKSEYKELIPSLKVLSKISKLVIDNQKIDKRHYFRMEHLRSELVVSDKVKMLIEKHSDDFSFIPVDEFQFDSTKSNIN
ncbi:MAG: hypothetical protein N4A72_08880 [Bacteroidales bacterium]|jgi:hypothetical protein|nr:hypothetical protein [Bacteroidales bacterium]